MKNSKTATKFDFCNKNKRTNKKTATKKLQ